MSADWLEFFDDPVVNDKMMSEASSLPAVKSEHSYSIGKESDGGDVLLKVKSEPKIDSTLDDNPGPAINPVSSIKTATCHDSPGTRMSERSNHTTRNVIHHCFALDRGNCHIYRMNGFEMTHVHLSVPP